MISFKLIESQSCERDYGLRGTIAIIEKISDGTRYLLEDGYCGERSLEGGCVRWSGGAIYRILPSDTLESLMHVPDDSGRPGEPSPQCWETLYSRIAQQYDELRPCLAWSGHTIESVAKSLSL